MKKLMNFLPHLAIALSICVATMTVLDGYNPFLSFLTSDVSKLFLYVFCAVTFVSSVNTVVHSIRRKNRKR